ncbi:protein GFS12 [Aristolochia californica]|uniref:protein GFS12 n=1 Tax=Aristolochia californica TaxID=171875 RepID=UPI0035E36B88
MEERICFGCLQKLVQEDFSEKLVFCYGISDSAIPFGSRAVIQVDLAGTDKAVCEEVSPQFILAAVAKSQDECLSRYIDGYLDEKDSEGGKIHDKEKASSSDTGQCLHDGSVSPASKNGCHYFMVGSGKKLGEVSSGSFCLNYSSRFLCSRTITALAPIAFVGTGSFTVIKDLVHNFILGTLEDHLMSSINLLVEGKPTCRDGTNFLSLVGMPKFSENYIPGCVRHPNLVPVIGMLKTKGYTYLLYPKNPYTLENILLYSPKVLNSDWCIKFLIYQILSALAYIHGLRVSHGNVCPASVMLTDSCWALLILFNKPQANRKMTTMSEDQLPTAPPSVSCCRDTCSSHSLYVDLKLSTTMDWRSDFKRWWKGELSNYEYLLVLNRLAGRRWGDHTFHTVMPWVIDFSAKPDENSDAGWRDLQKSKWRLAKGDEQLDFTYSTSEIPHHVSDECLSELAVCSYKARRLPLSVLRSAVRSVYEPNEYPSNMQRLYQWTPDECIPEFYSDPQVFVSLHSGMTDLAIPAWATSPEEFISMHRAALESPRVSREIHNWIDITFGYKMSGKSAIAAKNVMLPTSDHMMPKSMGRHQLFTRPHPVRRGCTQDFNNCSKKHTSGSNIKPGAFTNDASGSTQVGREEIAFLKISELEELEGAISFSEYGRDLDPLYAFHPQDSVESISVLKEQAKEHIGDSGESLESSNADLGTLLEYLENDDSAFMGFQELLLWRQRSSIQLCSEYVAADIFSIGCILAELYLKRPLFNPISLAAYKESGILPVLVHELPPQAQLLVEACIQKDWRRRPSAKSLLESPYFLPTIRSAYLFLAPIQLLVSSGSRLHYASKLARAGALRSMGQFAAEMCAPYCLPLITMSLTEIEAESALYLLMEFLKCLKSRAVQTLILPVIQKILQATDYSHLKVLLLQNSFVREIWRQLGKQVYLEKIHPLVIANLYISPHKNSATAASVLLIGSCEELGVPVTVHQTILPLIQCFGKGLCTDGIDCLVRIGGLFGVTFIVQQLLPLLRNVILSCIDVLCLDKPEPLQSWNALALTDALVTLDGLVLILSIEVIVKELIQDQICLHVKVLLQTNLDLPVLQIAATALLSVCQRIGPEFTALHVLPQLKELFDELAFSPEKSTETGSSGRIGRAPKSKTAEGTQFQSRMDLVLILYPSFASLLGIEKLRQGCATWLLLEQYLQRFYNWKWDCTGETSRVGADAINNNRSLITKLPTSEYNPAKLLLNGVGWSVPQTQGIRGGKSLVSQKQFVDLEQNPAVKYATAKTPERHEPWFWFHGPATSWDGPDFLSRAGNVKDELPWKIKAAVLHSVRAHPGSLRTLAVGNDECTVFTGGAGPSFRGTVQKWELSKMDCLFGYYGHEEVVNDICILSSSGRVASCDGTIHVWNGGTGKLISAYSEPSTNSSHSLLTASKVHADQSSMLNPGALSGGILSAPFSGGLYTCMHHIEFQDKLVAGIGNGSLRFVDVAEERQLHLWKSDPLDYNFSSLVSTICSCGSGKLKMDRGIASSAWIAVGLSSGHCRLLDARSGNVIAFWRAHDGFITKLASPQDHLLISSSLDKTLRVWDLRRDYPSQPIVFRGHSDSISGFSFWGQDIISVSRNKIGLCSLSRSVDEHDGQQMLSPQKLYSADRGARNLSILSSISILPFSRLFLVGTEDGYLKICC